MKSSFNGVISEIPGISVDNFEPANVNARAFFLSHCHTDHTNGLFGLSLLKALDITRAYIYMSEPTSVVIKDQLCKELHKHVKVLQLGRNSITLPRSGTVPELNITVTLIPAGHCFGSVMFLFETTNTTVLYTGDFRMSVDSASAYSHFHNSNGDVKELDALYVDTTFIDENHDNFPKRSETVDYMIRELRTWLNEKDNNMVALHTSAMYGYEYVFNTIYEELGIKVYVDHNRWRVYKQVPHLVPGVTNEETRIHTCRYKYQNSHETCVTNIENANFQFINLSAWKWRNHNINLKGISTLDDSTKDVCFATHCSKSEVMDFIRYFDPKKVVGFPNEVAWPPNKNLGSPNKGLSSPNNDGSPNKVSGSPNKSCSPNNRVGSPRKRAASKTPVKVEPNKYNKVDPNKLRQIFED